MSKEENIKEIVKNIAEEINDKEFLTYAERNEWEQYLTDIIDIIIEKENKELKDNWNKLKEHLIKEIDDWEDVNDAINDQVVISMVQEDKNILLKMQELENGDNNAN